MRILKFAFQHEFWTEPRGLGHNVDIQVAPEHAMPLVADLEELNIPYSVMINDLEK